MKKEKDKIHAFGKFNIISEKESNKCEHEGMKIGLNKCKNCKQMRNTICIKCGICAICRKMLETEEK